MEIPDLDRLENNVWKTINVCEDSVYNILDEYAEALQKVKICQGAVNLQEASVTAKTNAYQTASKRLLKAHTKKHEQTCQEVGNELRTSEQALESLKNDLRASKGNLHYHESKLTEWFDMIRNEFEEYTSSVESTIDNFEESDE